jgi:tripartite-type tricarboxylate transporter receptor subunit TctC
MQRFVSVLSVAALALPLAALAQTWPAKPVRVVVGTAAGGPPDLVARAVTPRLGELLGQPVIVENRPGAGGVIAMEHLTKSAPDGYTLGLGTIGMLLAKALIPTADFDPVKSFQQIGMFTKTSFVLVANPKLPASTAGELIALARAQPGKLNYGASQVGSPPHILAEMFKTQAGVNITGINYKSSPDSVQALLSGDVQILVDALPAALPLINSGKVKPLLVVTSTRLKKLPDVPSAPESGLPEYAVDSWFSLMAPLAVPNAVIRRVNAELNRTVESKDVVATLDRIGFETVSGTPEQAAALVAKDWPRWAAAVKASGAKAQ